MRNTQYEIKSTLKHDTNNAKNGLRVKSKNIYETQTTIRLQYTKMK